MNVDNLDFQKSNGLIPAIVQDADNFQVLMLGYMNREAVEKTLKTKRVTFFSRSKERLWTKGETSGNFLDVVDIQSDCDNDTLLILANPQGPVCHTGEKSCFHQKDFSPADSLSFLNGLEKLIISRKEEMPHGSYTSSLFEKGIDQIAQKVGEEAVETVIEAKNKNKNKLIDETSDLLFHLMVLLAEYNISLTDITAQLKKRHAKRE